MYKHLRAPSDVFGCNNKNFVPDCHKLCVAQLPCVGVEESTNKMVPHEPLHPVLIIRPRVIAKGISENCLDVSIQPLQRLVRVDACLTELNVIEKRNKKIREPSPRVDQPQETKFDDRHT